MRELLAQRDWRRRAAAATGVRVPLYELDSLLDVTGSASDEDAVDRPRVRNERRRGPWARWLAR